MEATNGSEMKNPENSATAGKLTVDDLGRLYRFSWELTKKKYQNLFGILFLLALVSLISFIMPVSLKMYSIIASVPLAIGLNAVLVRSVRQWVRGEDLTFEQMASAFDWREMLWVLAVNAGVTILTLSILSIVVGLGYVSFGSPGSLEEFVQTIIGIKFHLSKVAILGIYGLLSLLVVVGVLISAIVSKFIDYMLVIGVTYRLKTKRAFKLTLDIFKKNLGFVFIQMGLGFLSVVMACTVVLIPLSLALFAVVNVALALFLIGKCEGLEKYEFAVAEPEKKNLTGFSGGPISTGVQNSEADI